MMHFIKTVSFMLTTLLFIGCGENTKNPVTSDILSITIDDNSTTSGFIYATDTSKILKATVHYQDGTSLDASDYVTWKNSDFSVLSMYRGEYSALANGGKSTISIEYGKFNDSLDIEVYALKSNSLAIFATNDINTTGTFSIEAKGDFIDIDTNATVDSNRTILNNILWSTTNDAVITIDDNNLVQVEIIKTGETNITASVFDYNVTKTFIIN